MTDLERFQELSSRLCNDDECLEHFNLKNKLEQRLQKGDKWDKYSKQCIVTFKDNETTIKPIINKELEQENEELKENNEHLTNEIKMDMALINEDITTIRKFEEMFKELDELVNGEEFVFPCSESMKLKVMEILGDRKE